MDIVDLQQMWAEGLDGQRSWRGRAEECIRFYKGFSQKQWDAADLQVLQTEKRPALTLNKIAPIINFLSGYQRQNRLDITVLPQRPDAQGEAAVVNHIIKQTIDNNNGHYEISAWFDDAIKTGIGWMSGYIDYTHDPIKGDLKLERVNPLFIVPDPCSTKYDLSDCEYIFRATKVRLKTVMDIFPEKEDEIMAGGEIDYADLEIHPRENISGDIAYSSTRILMNQLRPNEQVTIKDCWYLKTSQVAYVYIADKGEVIEYGPKDKKLDEMVAAIPNAVIIERQKKTLYKATYIGSVLLQDVKDPLGSVNKLPFVPLYAYRDDTETGDNVWGLIDNLIDPQKEINKRRSQSLHILNTQAHSGWLMEDGSIEDEGSFKKQGSTPGALLKYRKGAMKPDRITPVPPSQGHVVAEQAANSDMKEISGVNPDLLGARAERSEPGIVIQLRQQQGLIVIQNVFDNLRHSLSLLGQLMIDVIQGADTYTQNEIMQAVPEELQQYVPAVFNNKQMSRYNVSIITQSSTPTARSMDFYKLIEMVKMGLPIPPDILLKASDLPYKEEMLARLEQAQQMQAGAVAPDNMGGAPVPPLNMTGELG